MSYRKLAAGRAYTERQARRQVKDGELTPRQQAELLLDGIEASGLDAGTAFRALASMDPVKRAFAVQEYQLIGLGNRMAGLPGGLLPPDEGGLP